MKPLLTAKTQHIIVSY